MKGEFRSWGALARQLVGELSRWVIRRRSPGSTLVKVGGAVLIAALGGGWVLTISSRSGEGARELRLEAGAGVAEAISMGGASIGAILLFVGLSLVWRDWRKEYEAQQRRRVLVVEQRGLLARHSAPLAEAVPSSLVGKRESLVLDHTAHLRDGVVVDRGAAFMEARQIRRDVSARLRDVAPGDATIVYGGVSPVPLTFLVGALLDDESAVCIWDWDRFRGGWREPDEADDGDRMSSPCLDAVVGANEALLVVSVSYAVDEAAAHALYPDLPVISMRLGNITVGNHWSEEKQLALAGAFVDAMVSLEASGVRQVHLFLAAPNSVVFRFGRAYDGRNMPEIIVYQYERSDPLRFPWGIRMPHHGEAEPALCFPTVSA